MGSSIAHPRESDEWKGMSLDQKFEFFAPIWRVMVSRRSSCLALRCCQCCMLGMLVRVMLAWQAYWAPAELELNNC